MTEFTRGVRESDITGDMQQTRSKNFPSMPYVVPVLPDVPTLCNGRANAIRKDLQKFLDLIADLSPVTPTTIGHAFRQYGLSELLCCHDFEDADDLFDLIIHHLFSTLHNLEAQCSPLPVLLVLHYFQVCGGRSVKITLPDLRLLAALSRDGTVVRILGDAEICLHSGRSYLDTQGRRLAVSAGPGDGPPSVGTGRTVRAVIHGSHGRLYNADTNAQIFNENFIYHNDLFPLLKDLSTLIPPPIHNPHSHPQSAGPAGTTTVVGSAGGNNVVVNGVGVVVNVVEKKKVKNLAYKLNRDR